MRLSSLCERLERDCRDGDVGDATALAEEIAAEETRVRHALETISASDLDT